IHDSSRCASIAAHSEAEKGTAYIKQKRGRRYINSPEMYAVPFYCFSPEMYAVPFYCFLLLFFYCLLSRRGQETRAERESAIGNRPAFRPTAPEKMNPPPGSGVRRGALHNAAPLVAPGSMSSRCPGLASIPPNGFTLQSGIVNPFLLA